MGAADDSALCLPKCRPDAEIYLSQPGLGVVLGARVLAEFGDDKTRYADARSRKNYAGTASWHRDWRLGQRIISQDHHRRQWRTLDRRPGGDTRRPIGPKPGGNEGIFATASGS